MYGPRSAYDSATLAEYDRRVEEKLFADRLLRALKDKRVAKAIKKILQEKGEEAE